MVVMPTSARNRMLSGHWPMFFAKVNGMSATVAFTLAAGIWSVTGNVGFSAVHAVADIRVMTVIRIDVERTLTIITSPQCTNVIAGL